MTPLRHGILWLTPVLVTGWVMHLRVSGFSLPTMRGRMLELLARLSSTPPGLLHAPPHALEMEMIFLSVAALGIVLLLFSKGFWAAIAACMTAAVAALVFSWQIYSVLHIFFDPSFVLFGLGAITAAALFSYALDGLFSRTSLRRSLGEYSRPSTLDALAHEPKLLNLSGETRTMSYLACNLRDYGALVDNYANDAHGLSVLIRRMQTPFVEAVLDSSGTIDHLLPWGLTAFFNAPLEDNEHALHACECALRMTDALQRLNGELKNERRSDGSLVPPIAVGVAVNSGPGIAADFGTISRPQYSVTGRSAMFAVALVQLSSHYGHAIVVGDALRRRVESNFAFLEIDLVEDEKGEAVPLFALLGNAVLRTSPKFRALQTFHKHIFSFYRARNWAKTRVFIEQCRALSSASPQLYDLYLSRIAHYERHPPSENWNGVFQAEA